MTYAICLPTATFETTKYLSERGQPDFADYAAPFATIEDAERAMAYCEAGAVVVDHPDAWKFDDEQPSGEWIALHTDAPVAFDGFSTRTVKVVGKSKRGEAVRLIEVQKRDYEWQTMRYSTGAFVMYTAGGMTLEGNVRLGDWIIDG